jgi:hypothetical protein
MWTETDRMMSQIWTEFPKISKWRNSITNQWIQQDQWINDCNQSQFETDFALSWRRLESSRRESVFLIRFIFLMIQWC